MNARNCTTCLAQMPDLLLDAASPAATEARQHLAECPTCQEEFASLAATMASLDAWQAPEPSAWFDTRLHARLRAEQQAAPEGFLDRLRSRLLFSSGMQLRPVLVGGLALLLAIGGGTAVEITHLFHPPSVQASATIQDLQILDRNDQAMQTMDQLLDDNTPDDTPAAPAS